MAALTKEQRAAFLASNTQAGAARIVAMDGKTFRDTTRKVFGVYVSRDGTWDERTRAFRLAYHEASNADARKAIAQAFKDGADTPPKV